MTATEVREVVADLLDEMPTIMPDGRIRGHDWRPAGVHRRGATMAGPPNKPVRVLANVHWYETAMEWFARSAA